MVLEAGDDVGGRVRTDVVDGFRLDRGFQVLNPAYPALPHVVDVTALDLHPYDPGILLVGAQRRWVVADPVRSPRDAVATLRAPFGSPWEKARLSAYLLRLLRSDVADLLAEPDSTALAGLRSAGIRGEPVDRLLRPFLTGVFLEPDLATSHRFAQLVLRAFAKGSPGLPAQGMHALPRLVADPLPSDVVHLGERVRWLDGATVDTGGERWRARAVVVATGPRAAADLLPSLPRPVVRSATTWYHVPDIDPRTLADGRRLLSVDPLRRGPVVNTSVLSTVAPSYAPPGRVLVSSTTLGTDDSSAAAAAVLRHLSVIYGVPTADWPLLRAVVVPDALPAMLAPLDVRAPTRLGGGLFVCGDHRDTASLQGAIVSGRRAATAVIAALGLGADGERP